MSETAIELRPHPAMEQNPLTGEMESLFPGERSIWWRPAGKSDFELIGYCGIGPTTPINLIAPPSRLPTRYRDAVVELIRAERLAANPADADETGGGSGDGENGDDRDVPRDTGEVNQAVDPVVAPETGE